MFKQDIKPIDAVVAITYKCNSRCNMCDIWKIRDHHDVDRSFYSKLPQSLRFINISGGEPFLRPDIVEIIELILKRCPKAKLVISSNGFATNVVIDRMKKILAIADGRVGIALSIDGMQQMHDQIRGIQNGFNKIIRTIEELKKIGMPAQDIRIALTVTGENVKDLNELYDLSQKMGVQFTMSFAQSSDFYFGGKQNDVKLDEDVFEHQMKTLIKKQLKGFDVKRWLRAFFVQGIYDFAKKQQQPLPVVSGSKHFFVDPKGDIYPSVVHNMIMGNIKEANSFDDIWYGDKANEIRAKIHKANKPVWMICTARTAIIKHPFRVLKWILKNKITG